MAETEDLLADGNVKVVFLAGSGSVANLTAPTDDELNAENALDLSCFIKSDGKTHTADQATVDNGKLCDTNDKQKLGRTTHSWALTYAKKKNAVDDKAYNTLKNYVTGILVERVGPPASQPFAADDVVDLYEVTCGVQIKKTDKNDVVWIDAQKLAVSGSVETDVEVVAAA